MEPGFRGNNEWGLRNPPKGFTLRPTLMKTGAAISRYMMRKFDKAALRRWTQKSLLVVALLAAPAAYSEVEFSGAGEPEPGTLLGNYLSGRIARGDHDTAAAADFYSKALAEDPSNEIILEQAFLLETASAHWDRAIELAHELVKIEPAHRIA